MERSSTVPTTLRLNHYLGRSARLLDLCWRRALPGLAGPETHWFSTWPMLDQARRIEHLLADHGERVAFSVDLAPGLDATWRHPTLTIVFSDMNLQLEGAGFVPAEGRGDASIMFRCASDVRLLSPAPGWSALSKYVSVVLHIHHLRLDRPLPCGENWGRTAIHSPR